MSPLRAHRLPGNPIIHGALPGLEGETGANINGPSLLRVPSWVERPLGRYYLYFGHHHGTHIRLAWADGLEGPWSIMAGGVLPLEATAARSHLASPDVHVDVSERRIRLYFHGVSPIEPGEQVTFVATSPDGLHFEAHPEPLGPFYFRVFTCRGEHYALAKLGNESGVLLHSADGLSPFEAGPSVFPAMRHAAVEVRDESLEVIFSRIGDAPEQLLHATVDLRGDWREWRPSEPVPLLAPELDWEGADQPVRPSRPGRAFGRERALRDPAFFEDGSRRLLVYAVAGEQGLALAELSAD